MTTQTNKKNIDEKIVEKSKNRILQICCIKTGVEQYKKKTRDTVHICIINTLDDTYFRTLKTEYYPYEIEMFDNVYIDGKYVKHAMKLLCEYFEKYAIEEEATKIDITENIINDDDNIENEAYIKSIIEYSKKYICLNISYDAKHEINNVFSKIKRTCMGNMSDIIYNIIEMKDNYNRQLNDYQQRLNCF